ncbi:MAG: hypothetical protein IPQ19_01745 [Bacteroidetes bacterium]|nr:hypothetical protein [Bacteroidota bacterium]
MVRGLSPREENDFDILKSDSILEMLVEKKTQYVTLGRFYYRHYYPFRSCNWTYEYYVGESVTERTWEIRHHESNWRK